jgi:copper chaperone CopZ
MKQATAYIILLMLVLLSVSCRKRDIRTALIHVPRMKNEACVERVVKALKGRPGVLKEAIEVDRERRIVLVPYNSIELSLKNLEFAVAQAGFQANNVPADATAAAKLPTECR